MRISEEALKAADSICNYCSTRFPESSPPHAMLDRPWFAEKVQLAIDSATERLRKADSGRDVAPAIGENPS